MLRKIWFQAHWLVGITAGVVLAVVGTTGAILAFEVPIQNWLNRDVRTVAASGTSALSPAALTAEIQKQAPDKRVTSLQFSNKPGAAVRVVFAPDATAPRAANVGGRGPARGETRYANPYTGGLLRGNANRGQAFFRTTRSIHRWLTAGELGNQDIGRQIVGASTALCVILALSGLYLRWPRRIGNWRVWLTFNPALKGRSFLWHLHAVLGTWVLIGFLLMSLTGLYWSYEWYRDGLYAMAGVERPAPRDQPRDQPRNQLRDQGSRLASGRRESNARAGRSEGAPESRDESSSPGALNDAWTNFKATLDGAEFTTATLTFEPGRPIEIRYLHEDSSHDRANNMLLLDPNTGSVLKHEQYEAKRTGEKFMASIFPLHSGSFFGLPGTIAYMLASLAMPVFTVTGWMMYLARRRQRVPVSRTNPLTESRSTDLP